MEAVLTARTEAEQVERIAQIDARLLELAAIITRSEREWAEEEYLISEKAAIRATIAVQRYLARIPEVAAPGVEIIKAGLTRAMGRALADGNDAQYAELVQLQRALAAWL
jgi:hypothetical protein